MQLLYKHYAEALNHYWKNNAKTHNLIADFNKTELNLRQLALCRFAHRLTTQPGAFEEEHETNRLKLASLTDNAILDATLVVAYFNFVNLIIMALGVEPDEDETKGYKY